MAKSQKAQLKLRKRSLNLTLLELREKEENIEERIKEIREKGKLLREEDFVPPLFPSPLEFEEAEALLLATDMFALAAKHGQSIS